MNEESKFLDSYNKDSYEKPSLTADVLTFAINSSDDTYNLQVLLLERDELPYKGFWSLPGGFMKIDETLEETAMRVSANKTNIHSSYLEQLYTFSDVKRDPRMRIVSTTYLNLINKTEALLPSNCKWFDLSITKTGDALTNGEHIELTATNKNITLKATCRIKTLSHPNRLEKTRQEIVVIHSDFGFDHAKMICLGYLRLLNKITYSNLAFHFMDEEFSLPSLQKVYECILQKELYKTSFRTSIKHMVEETGNKTKIDGFSKPSKLYRYKGGYEL